MDFSSYHQKISKFGTDKFNKENLETCLSWLKNEGLEIYKKEFLALSGLKKFPSRNETALIEQAIVKNLNDYKKKIIDVNYYVSNALIFIEIAEWISESTLECLKNFQPKEKDLVIYNYSHLIHYMLLDSVVLLNKYKVNIDNETDEKKLYGVGKVPWQHTMGYWQFIRQVIFGQSSFHSFIDRELDMSIGIIRMAVEIRLRRGFGILGKIKKEDMSIHPLAVETLIDCLKQHKNDIEMPIPIHILERIYGWANIFTHSGLKDYSWLPVKIWLYLREFLIGVKENGWNINNGIKISHDTLKSIQECIRSKINSDIYDIWIIEKPDAIVLE